MNSELLKNFTREEVEAALKDIKPLSALGPDGMPPIFFQSFWYVVGDDISQAVLDCLNNCHIPSDLNHTYVTLIPKVKSPEKFQNLGLLAFVTLFTNCSLKCLLIE